MHLYRYNQKLELCFNKFDFLPLFYLVGFISNFTPASHVIRGSRQRITCVVQRITSLNQSGDVIRDIGDVIRGIGVQGDVIRGIGDVIRGRPGT